MMRSQTETSPADAPPKLLVAIRALREQHSASPQSQRSGRGQRTKSRRSSPPVDKFDQLANQTRRLSQRYPFERLVIKPGTSSRSSPRSSARPAVDAVTLRGIVTEITGTGVSLTVDGRGFLFVDSATEPIAPLAKTAASRHAGSLVSYMARYGRCDCYRSRRMIYAGELAVRCSACRRRLRIQKRTTNRKS